MIGRRQRKKSDYERISPRVRKVSPNPGLRTRIRNFVENKKEKQGFKGVIQRELKRDPDNVGVFPLSLNRIGVINDEGLLAVISITNGYYIYEGQLGDIDVKYSEIRLLDYLENRIIISLTEKSRKVSHTILVYDIRLTEIKLVYRQRLSERVGAKFLFYNLIAYSSGINYYLGNIPNKINVKIPIKASFNINSLESIKIIENGDLVLFQNNGSLRVFQPEQISKEGNFTNYDEYEVIPTDTYRYKGAVYSDPIVNNISTVVGEYIVYAKINVLHFLDSSFEDLDREYKFNFNIRNVQNVDEEKVVVVGDVMNKEFYLSVLDISNIDMDGSKNIKNKSMYLNEVMAVTYLDTIKVLGSLDNDNLAVLINSSSILVINTEKSVIDYVIDIPRDQNSAPFIEGNGICVMTDNSIEILG
jgi:hypothetical protein